MIRNLRLLFGIGLVNHRSVVKLPRATHGAVINGMTAFVPQSMNGCSIVGPFFGDASMIRRPENTTQVDFSEVSCDRDR